MPEPFGKRNLHVLRRSRSLLRSGIRKSSRNRNHIRSCIFTRLARRYLWSWPVTRWHCSVRRPTRISKLAQPARSRTSKKSLVIRPALAVSRRRFVETYRRRGLGSGWPSDCLRSCSLRCWIKSTQLCGSGSA